MKRILVPYDGSESADRALLFAIDHSTGTQVHVLNVQEWPALYSELMTIESFQELQQKLTARGTEMVGRAAKVLADRKIAFQTHVRVGSIELAIIAVANEVRCEQIVMGTRGQGAAKSLLIGSVAQKVVHLADVPVTLVK